MLVLFEDELQSDIEDYADVLFEIIKRLKLTKEKSEYLSEKERLEKYSKEYLRLLEQKWSDK